MNKPILGLGAFRFMLALFVAVSHLNEGMIHGPAAYAVWGFYLLSGYLMTLILHEKYGFSLSGLRFYFINRALRIYPAYFFALLMGIIALMGLTRIGVSTNQFNPSFYLPVNWTNWAHVITLMPFIPYSGLPVSTSHALSLEIGMYLLSPLICKTRSTAILCIILSILANLQIGIHGSTFATRYATFLPCLMAFGSGSLLFHLKDGLAVIRMPFVSLMTWFSYCYIWFFFPAWPWKFGIYISLLLSAWVVISLSNIKNKIDDLSGDLSYPIYLLHVVIASIVGGAFNLQSRSPVFCTISVILTIGTSFAVSKYIEKPLIKFKKYTIGVTKPNA